MKLEARRIETFLRNPGAVRAVLLYGDDVGLIRERSAQITRAVAGSADDPFRVVELGAEAGVAIATEMAGLPMTGGRRVVRVRQATDQLAARVADVLEGPGPGLLILEAPDLAARSRLRSLFEQAPNVAAIGCYSPDDAARAQTIRGLLVADGVTMDAETLPWASGQLGGGNAAMTCREVEKLILYVGPNGHVDLETVIACVGDVAGASLEDSLHAATAGDVAGADRALEVALNEGVAAVSVVRTALGHVHRLERVVQQLAAGKGMAEAIRQARPPVFFRRAAQFERAVRLWTLPALSAAASRLWDADRLCKRTGFPGDTVAKNVVIGLAQRAAAASRR